MSLGLTPIELGKLLKSRNDKALAEPPALVDRSDPFAVMGYVTSVLELSIIEMIQANNQRIEEQLRAYGISLTH